MICCERFLLNSSVSSHCQQRCSHCGEEGPEELQQLRFSGVWGQDPRRQPGGKGAARSEPQPKKNLFETFEMTVEINVLAVLFRAEHFGHSDGEHGPVHAQPL